MTRTLSLALLVALGVASAARADIKINELYYSPEDPSEGRQFFEIINTAGAAPLTGLWLLEIDGDPAQADGQLDNPGQVLNAINLGAFSTGPNGLFLWRDSDTIVLDNDVAPGVQGPGITPVGFGGRAQAFGFEDSTDIPDPNDPNEEIEVVTYANDVHSFLLVSGFTGAVGDDLDALDSGVLNTSTFTSVLDGIAIFEDGSLGFPYAGQFPGGTVFQGGFGPDAWARTPGAGQWLFFDSGSGEEDEDYVGPFFANDGNGTPAGSEAAFQDGTPLVVTPASQFLYVTPGAGNLSGIVPEPAAATLAAMTLAAFAAIRRRVA
jgi:hypothetical protein